MNFTPKLIKTCLYAIFMIFFFINNHVYADSMCAEVKIQINQEATLERQAFDARMKINNGMSGVSLENVEVNVMFFDSEGNPVTATTDPDETGAKFFYRLDSMDNIESVDGNGVVGPSKTAEIHWLIIPAQGAAGDDGAGAVYNVGAKLSYTLAGETHEMEVTPDFIKVKPMPDLVLDYFLPKEVYGDDPFTQETEKIIPFDLGLRIKNQGKGRANNLKIDSAQPKIVENEQGLLIDFIIKGSKVDNKDASPTLLADIGNLESGKASSVRWIMTSSLTGRFISLDAVMTHSDELGGKLTSLIKPENIKTHELVHNVFCDMSESDNISDFLGKERDGNLYTLYKSNGNNTSVEDKSSSAAINSINSSKSELKFDSGSGFVYAKLTDPFSGNKSISKAVRSDGKVIPTENIWLSSKMREGNWEYFINIFDVDSTGEYLIYFSTGSSENKAPVIEDVDDKSFFEEELIEVLIIAEDENNDEIDLSLSPLPPGANFEEVDNGQGKFSWTPAKGQVGTYKIYITATDKELSSKKYFKIEVKNSSDKDLDGMADDWEMEHFGTLDRDGTGDYDNDGILDIDEFKYGTDPASSNAPSEPVIKYPLDKTESDTLTPELKITNSTDPDEDDIFYAFELYSDEGMKSLIKKSELVAQNNTETSWNHNVTLEENKSYFWRVRATDNKGYSSWAYGEFFVNSINEAPNPLTIISPENNEEVTTLTPKLIINNTTDPDLDELKYRFKIASDSQMTTIVSFVEDITEGNENKTSWTPGVSLNENTRYWLKAEAYDEDGLTSSTEINSFFVNTTNDSPTDPYIVHPENETEINTINTYLSVKNSIDPDEDTLKYRFMIDTSSTFDSPDLKDSGLIDEQTEFTKWDIKDLKDNTKYFFRVKADDNTASSNWSEGSFFVNTENDAPSTPKIKNPGNNSWVDTLTPTLEVFECTDIDNDILNYEFQIYEDLNIEGQLPVYEDISQTNSLSLSTELKDNVTYYWRVRAVDEHGLKSKWSTLSFFFTDNNGVNDSPVIEITSPDKDIYTNKDTFKITWTDEDPDNNSSISLYYDNDNSGTDGVLIKDNILENKDGLEDEFTWDISNISEGEYFIYGIIDDGETSTSSYSKFKLIIDRTDPLIQVSPEGAVYYEDKNIEASINEQGKIYYTNDGTEPGIDSMEYSGPVKVTETTTLKFIGIDLAGNMGPVSSQVYIMNNIPSTPVVKIPKDGQWVNTTKPSLEVFPPEHIDTEKIVYEFKVYEDKDLNQIVAEGSVNDPVWTINKSLLSNKSYFWIVRAVDDYGMASEWSLPSEFFINLSSDWQSGNIGHCWKKGSFENSGNRFVINASGFDIWGLLDTFKFTSQPVNKDCEIVARVESIQNTNKWAKAGLMIRESLKMNSKHAAIIVTPEKGIAFQYRKRTSWVTKSIDGGSSEKAPCWLKLKRSGNTFTAYKSSNGINWTKVASVEISMSDNAFAGMAVTSHNNLKLCRTVFTDTKVIK